MTEHVTVEAVKDARDWESEDGKIKNTYYTLDVKRENGLTQEVDHARKQGGKEPEPGEQLDVIFEEGKFRPKMKKAPSGSFAGQNSSPASSGASKGQGREWTPEAERDPERAARILRQHSQEMALRWLALGDELPEGLDQIGYLIDWFDQDVIKAANQAGGSPADPQAGAAPPTDASPSSGSQAPDEKRDLEMALAEPDDPEPLSAEARSKVADYMLTQLIDEDRDRACNQLTNKADSIQQSQTLRAMKKRTERWINGPLSQVSHPDDASIPF